MSEMIERVARAIKIRIDESLRRAFPPQTMINATMTSEHGTISLGDDLAIELAALAIEAMREPTEAMVMAVPTGHNDEQREILKRNWNAIINAALK